MSFQERLKELRLSKKYTQQDIADKLGITRQAYGYYENENSKREPDHASTIKLAEIFDVSTDYLLKGKEFRSEAEKILEDPDILAAARSGEMSKERALDAIEWLLEQEKGRKPGDRQPRRKK